ncbi:UDP-forming cellulose synthase catalytic subunit [Granulicella rosea]|uniref:UDP-forming cellulose synthase catalytic subunit n=1 Tax=Granulicella rosea TaxID=474952 RepID=UPI001FECF697|nr:UDP-forming cellulose synthase catalytic subunit [Granulicella rosea]
MSIFLGTQSSTTRILRIAVALLGTFFLVQFISLYLSWPKQIVLGGISIALALVLNRGSKSHAITISLMLFSLAATLRYGWWRIHTIVQFFGDESNDHWTIDSFLMLLLLSAEAYTILIMVLGFMQTSSPLRRKPIPLPADEDLWPHVDVLIPTYNEPLSLVRYTALAAINIDYPPEKLHVYILDDGTRESFRSFAEEAGVGYVVRSKHDHAKAGNINHALTKMNSPLVTIFDCDHVPTRSFLQVTVGWFLAEQKLAMLQTPHFFYSPDPFERNLLQYKSIPNEGELFYGVIQDGNDLWNATFFCGSCAVIRRAALNEVGGIATETVTEDAHTSLRMQKKGWNTAYINLPQAAGLATETLAAHVGQRIRWARGMIQILRTDNPMLASGMKFTQRLCYFNAMLHFMYAVPRLIFLLAPLVYMLGGRTIIPGYWVAILAYAMPHLVISSITNSRVQGKHRHSFWNEIYETVLAPYILMPTLLALINPKLGKFNVTDKGSTLSETTFDRHIAAPTTWLLFLNFLGLCAAPYRLLVTDPTHPGTVLSNLLWICFNMVILGVAAAVANEQMQRRSSVRIPAHIKVNLHGADGETVSGTTQDISVGGTALRMDNPARFTLGEMIQIAFPEQTGDDDTDCRVNAKVVGLRDDSIRLQFEAHSIAQQETLTRAIYSRADSWIGNRAQIEVDRPLVSLARVIRLSFTGFNQVLRGLLPRRKKKTAAALATASLLLALLATVNLLGQSPASQIPGAQIPGAQTAPAPAIDAAPLPAQPVAAASAATPQKTVRQRITLFTPATAPVAAEAANYAITFKDTGVHNAVEMHGPHSYQSVGLVLPHSLVPRQATLNLTYHFSPDLLPGSGTIKISLNNTPIAEIDAPEERQKPGEYGFVALPIPAALLIRSNEITFEFTGGTLLQSEASARANVLANIGASSTLLIAADRIPFKNDLSLLPQPIFDADLQTTTTIPFVFLAPPSPRMLQAAGVVASWLGIQASSKPIRFSVSVGHIPSGNVIVFAGDGATLPPDLHIPQAGGSLNIKANPSDPEGSALILAGQDDEQLLNVARALSLMAVAHLQPGETTPRLGESVAIGAFPLPAERQPDDAPRWLTTSHLTSLWELSSQQALTSDGSHPLPVYLRVPPDLHYGEKQNLDLKLTYRYNALPLAAGSFLRVFANGTLINEAPLQPGADFSDRQRSVILPVAAMRPFGNTFLFNFDFVPANPGAGNKDASSALSGAILRNSYVDLRGLAHWAAMPNLELLANAGFPFTRRADLADTTIVVPTTPTAGEIALFLYLMSHCGAQTGYPALRVEVAGPDAVMRSGRDYLILGGTSDQPAFNAIENVLPVTYDANGVHVQQTTGTLQTLRAYWQRLIGNDSANHRPSNIGGIPDLVLEGIQSPFSAGNSIVVVAMRNDEAADRFADVFLERSQSSDISQSVSLLRDGRFSSYTMDTPVYHVGDIAAYPLLRIWLAEHVWLLLFVVGAFSLVLATYIRDYLALLAEERLRVVSVR